MAIPPIPPSPLTGAGISAAGGALTITQKLLRVMRKAQNNNIWDLPVMASPPTISAVSNSSPVATLPSVATLSSTPTVINHFGGLSTAAGGVLTLTTTTRSDGSKFTYSGVVEVESDAPILGFGFQDTSLNFLVEVDGQLASTTPTTGSAAGGTLYFTVDFSSRKVRRVRIHCSSPARFLYKTQADRAWAPGVDDVVRCAVMGDSFVAATGASSLHLSFPNVLGSLLGFRDTRAIGIGGTGYLAPGSGTAWKSLSHISDVTSINPDIVVFEHGLNDASFGSAVQAEALLNYQAVRAACPTAIIVVLGSQSGNSGPSAAVLTVESAISAAVTQMNDRYCKFAAVSADPTGAWINGTGSTGSPTGSGNADIYNGGVSGTDAVHPNDAGHAYLARRAAKAVRSAVQAMVS